MARIANGAKGLADAAEELKRGRVVAVPTETVYGLAANALSDSAVAAIYRLKCRPADNPLIVHVSTRKMLMDIVDADFPPEYERCMSRFWPGPLTMIFKAKKCLSKHVRTHADTVAVRMPSDATFRSLIDACGFPLAAPSANKSGLLSPTTAHAVLEGFEHDDLLVVDGGACALGIESTVISCLGAPVVLRPGSLAMSALAEEITDIKLATETGGVTQSPGTKYRHYRPRVPLVLLAVLDRETVPFVVSATRPEKIAFLVRESAETYADGLSSCGLLQTYTRTDANVTITCFEGGGRSVFVCTAGNTSEQISVCVFDALRQLGNSVAPDGAIFSFVPERDADCAGVRDRMFRAATAVFGQQ